MPGYVVVYLLQKIDYLSQVHRFGSTNANPWRYDKIRNRQSFMQKRWKCLYNKHNEYALKRKYCHCEKFRHWLQRKSSNGRHFRVIVRWGPCTENVSVFEVYHDSIRWVTTRSHVEVLLYITTGSRTPYIFVCLRANSRLLKEDITRVTYPLVG